MQMNHLQRLAQMGMPLVNPSPLMPVQGGGNPGGVTLPAMPAAPQMPANPMTQMGGPGLGMLMMGLQKQQADAKRGGPVPGIALPMRLQDAIGSQIQTASMPPVIGLDTDGSFRGTVPSITGEAVPNGAGLGFKLGNIWSGLGGWFGGFGR